MKFAILDYVGLGVLEEGVTPFITIQIFCLNDRASSSFGNISHDHFFKVIKKIKFLIKTSLFCIYNDYEKYLYKAY